MKIIIHWITSSGLAGQSSRLVRWTDREEAFALADVWCETLNSIHGGRFYWAQLVPAEAQR